MSQKSDIPLAYKRFLQMGNVGLGPKATTSQTKSGSYRQAILRL